MTSLKICFDKKIYDRLSLIKSSYTFIDCAYIHLSQNDSDYIVDIICKDGMYDNMLEEKFKNEMIIQCARQLVYNNTKDIRKILLSRAAASTIIMDESGTDGKAEPEISEAAVNTDNIFKDWFDADDN